MSYSDFRMANLLQLTGFDWPTALAFAVMALVYLFAPWLGYRSGSRGLILAALWVLLAKVGAGTLKLGLLFFAVTSSGFKGKDAEMMFVLINCLEAGVFLLSLLLFVVGLPLLRREDQAPPLMARVRGLED